MSKSFILIFLFSITLFGITQEVDHVDDTVSIEYSINIAQLNFDTLPYQSADGFQHYRPFEKNDLPMARSGNLGLGLHNYTLGNQDWSISSHIGAYQPYLFTKDSLKYFKMSRPFTLLSYTNGSKAEQLFNVFHSQNLGEGLNISFEYRRLTSEGYYIRQLTNHTQFNSTYNLQNKSGSFKSRGYFLINDIEAQENGGIILSLNEAAEENTVLLDVNLSTGQNQSRTQAVGARNEIDLLKDSSQVFVNLSHEIDWNKTFRNYSDDTLGSPNFYQNFFLDNEKSADSSFTQNVSNSLALNLLDQSINIGVRNERIQYYQNSFIDEKYTSNYIFSKINYTLLGQELNLVIEKGVSGFHKNEIDAQLRVEVQEMKGIKTVIEIGKTAKQADYLYANQRGNHFNFKNDFETSKATSFSLKTKIKKYKLKVDFGYTKMTDYIYIENTNGVIRPSQFENGINNIHVQIEKKFTFLRHMNLLNTLRYQTFSEEEVVPLPNFISYHSLYYENLFFKKSLLFQLGVDLFYIGKYDGYQYSPALAQFHLNNKTNGLGQTLQLDLFINMRVNKSFRILLKMENVNANSFSEKTYRVQDYPIPGRSLKVGLSWRMIN